MSDEDREKLMELCKKEIYAEKLGAKYVHSKEDRQWWVNLKHQCEDEYDRVINCALREYKHGVWKEG